MKPGVSQGEKLPTTVIVQQPTNDEKLPQKRRSRSVLIISCFTLLCVCSISLGLYFGLRNKAGDVIVKNNVFFQEPGGDMIPANATLTKQEEVYEFPNAKVIYDFSTGLTVYKSKVDGEKDLGCLVDSFLMNETKTPDDVEALIEKDEVICQTEYEDFRVTDVWLNEEALGTLSRALCSGQQINFVQKVKDGSDDDDEDELPDLGEEAPERNQRRAKRGWWRSWRRCRWRCS